MTVLVLNGPNLGRLGVREPDVYGTATYDDLVARCTEVAQETGLEVEVRQTDVESEMIGWLPAPGHTLRWPYVMRRASSAPPWSRFTSATSMPVRRSGTCPTSATLPWRSSSAWALRATPPLCDSLQSRNLEP